MRLIADKAFRYAGKPLAVGDDFEANTRDGRVLVALNRAHVAEGDEPAKPRKPAKTEKVDQAEKPAKPRKRTYKRRDMEAED